MQQRGSGSCWELGAESWAYWPSSLLVHHLYTPRVLLLALPFEKFAAIFWGEKIELPTSRRLEWCPDTWFVEKWRQTPDFFHEISSLSQKMYHFQEKLTRLPTYMGRTSMKSQLSYHIHVRLTSTPRTIFAVACLGKKNIVKFPKLPRLNLRLQRFNLPVRPFNTTTTTTNDCDFTCIPLPFRGWWRTSITCTRKRIEWRHHNTFPVCLQIVLSCTKIKTSHRNLLSWGKASLAEALLWPPQLRTLRWTWDTAMDIFGIDHTITNQETRVTSKQM